jgi:hypothetical protein
VICSTVCGGTPIAALLPEPSAGEISFQGAEPAAFVFTSGADPMPVTFAGIALTPESTDFSSPSEGVLRYDGAETKRFRVSWSTAFLWAAATGGVTLTTFLISALLNGESVMKSTNGSTGDIGTVFGHSSQFMLELNPGDELQVGITSLNAETFTLSMLTLVLFANEV